MSVINKFIKRESIKKQNETKHTHKPKQDKPTCLDSKGFFSGVRILLISGPAVFSLLPKNI